MRPSQCLQNFQNTYNYVSLDDDSVKSIGVIGVAAIKTVGEVLFNFLLLLEFLKMLPPMHNSRAISLQLLFTSWLQWKTKPHQTSTRLLEQGNCHPRNDAQSWILPRTKST